MTIACSLSAADQRQRLAELDELARNALLGREPIEGGVRLTFDAAARDRVAAFVAAESECCPFLSLQLRLVLDVTGPDEAAPLVDELLA